MTSWTQQLHADPGLVVLQKEALDAVIQTLAELAERERDTVMLGRTTGSRRRTFGLKIAVFLDEFARHLEGSGG